MTIPSLPVDASLPERLEHWTKVLESLPEARATNADPCSLPNLLWLCQTIQKEGRNWSPDKTGRWLGFVEGVMAERDNAPVADWPFPSASVTGVSSTPASPIMQAHATLLERYITLSASDPDMAGFCEKARARLSTLSHADMGVLMGVLQGRLCARGLCDVKTERDISRPLFHAAYQREGQVVPPTLARKTGP